MKLCFEVRLDSSVPTGGDGFSAALDEITVTDGTGREFVNNGNFETGDLSSWSVDQSLESQNILSPEREMEGLRVFRTFYTVPNQIWARHADTFINDSGNTIQARIHYTTDLGSNGAGIISFVEGTDGQGVVCRDGSGEDRDVGFLFPGATNVAFTSASGAGMQDGGEFVTATYDISVPPGDYATTLAFLWMTSCTDDELSQECLDLTRQIQQNVHSPAETHYDEIKKYLEGLMELQLDSLVLEPPPPVPHPSDPL